MNPAPAAAPQGGQGAMAQRGPQLRRTGVKGPARRVPRNEQEMDTVALIAQLEDLIVALTNRVLALEGRAAVLENHVEGIDNDLAELIPRVGALEADRGFTEINEIDAPLYFFPRVIGVIMSLVIPDILVAIVTKKLFALEHCACSVYGAREFDIDK